MENINLDILGTAELKKIMVSAQKELFKRRLRVVELAMGKFQTEHPLAGNLPILQERLSLLKRKSAKPTFNAFDESIVDVLEDLEFWMEVED